MPCAPLPSPTLSDVPVESECLHQGSRHWPQIRALLVAERTPALTANTPTGPEQHSAHTLGHLFRLQGDGGLGQPKLYFYFFYILT